MNEWGGVGWSDFGPFVWKDKASFGGKITLQ